jgi:hypothetical protein
MGKNAPSLNLRRNKMSYFEAYLLWQLNYIQGLFVGLSILSGIAVLIFFVMTVIVTCEDGADEAEPWRDWLKRCLWVLVPVLILSIVIPSTETVLKIIATKKGVDAIQSQTFTGYIDQSAKVVDNSLKLLNQEIERKLEKKEATDDTTSATAATETKDK